MIAVYEDNGDGLHMTDGKLVVSGFQSHDQPGRLMSDITSWEDWCQDSLLTTEEYVEGDDYGRLIATYNEGLFTLQVSDLGIAGKRYAGITEIK